MHRDGPEGRRTPVHDRLGKRVDSREQLEIEANARVYDKSNARVYDKSNARYPEVQRIHITYEDLNQWCPGGLIRSQKRRLQRMRDRERQEEDHARK